jgi:hypothetical protein
MLMDSLARSSRSWLRRRHPAADKTETADEARVRELFSKQEGLREFGTSQGSWLERLVVKVVENKLRPAGTSLVALDDMTVGDAKIMGAGLAASLATSLTAEAAVEEWMLRYPALKELELK